MTSFKYRQVAALALLAGIAVSTAGAASTASTPAPASAPAPRWHHGPGHLFDQLGLSADQKASIKAIFESSGKQVRELHQKMRANMDKLHAVTPDDANYSALVSQVAQDNGALTTQVISAQGEMRARIHAVLTPAQKTQLATLESSMKADMKTGGRHRGHHGPWSGQDAGPDAPPAD